MSTMLLTLMLDVGLQEAWRLPQVDAESLVTAEHYIRTAVAAEEAGIDALFMADTVEFVRDGSIPPRVFEPLTLLSFLAAHTTTIGLVPTVSTSFTDPYNLARYLGSLDLLSQGRVGVNLVTSFMGERQFGQSLPRPEQRYARAREFAQVLTELWSSWPADTYLYDKQDGFYFRDDTVQPINHIGDFFSVAGPLNVPPSPQGRPLIGQAGVTQEGIDFAAEFADFTYTLQPTLPDAIQYAQNLERRAQELRGNRKRPVILTGAVVITAPSRKEAEELSTRLRGRTDSPRHRVALSEKLGGVDLSGLDLDDSIPESRLPTPESLSGRQGRPAVYQRLARQGSLSIRQLIEEVVLTDGHLSFVGTPEEVADGLAERFATGCTDGFNVWPSHHPHGLDLFFSEVVPALEQRGLFQRRPGTLREKFQSAAG